ncbi:MAG: hypothetical protein AABW80_04615 [Nanoarchaeota archaeon]
MGYIITPDVQPQGVSNFTLSRYSKLSFVREHRLIIEPEDFIICGVFVPYFFLEENDEETIITAVERRLGAYEKLPDAGKREFITNGRDAFYLITAQCVPRDAILKDLHFDQFEVYTNKEFGRISKGLERILIESGMDELEAINTVQTIFESANFPKEVLKEEASYLTPEEAFRAAYLCAKESSAKPKKRKSRMPTNWDKGLKL